MEIQLSSPRIWLYETAVDFRKSIDGLSELATAYINGAIHEDIFVFYNKAKNKVKLLAWHGNGFILLYKRLERGKFVFSNLDSGCASLEESQLSWLLAGLDWVKMSSWKTLKYEDYF